MKKAPKFLLFIDTNVFLDFYRAENEASLSLLKHVESIPEVLITSDQVEVEFLNNRQRVISAALQSLKTPSLSPFVPAYLSDSRAASRIERNLDDIKAQISSLKKRLARILENPASHDPVFRVVKKACSFRSPINLKYCEAKRDKIFEGALRRFQRGFPPRKREDTSAGDAINWEWIIDCANQTGVDVLIVSRDGDFGLRLDGKHYLNDWLKQEFKERVSPRRKIEFTTSLVSALRKLAVPVTKAEEEGERTIMSQASLPPEKPTLDLMWHQLLGHVGKVAPFIRTYLLDAEPVFFEGKVLTIGFKPQFADCIPLIDNPRNHTLLQTFLGKMGMGDMRVRFVAVPGEGDAQE